jgi:hypothetical protein
LTGPQQSVFLLMKETDTVLPLQNILKFIHQLIIIKSDLNLNRILIYQYNPYKTKLVLIDTWKPQFGKIQIYENIFRCINMSFLGFLRGFQAIFTDLHRNLDGYQLKVTHPAKHLDLNLMPYFYAGKKEGGGDYYEGHDIKILIFLSKQMNFEYILRETVDGTWGSPGPNGTSWTGMIGMVQRNVRSKNSMKIFCGKL